MSERFFAYLDCIIERERIRAACAVIIVFLIMGAVLATAFLYAPKPHNANATYTSTTTDAAGVTTTVTINGGSSTTVITNAEGNIISTMVTSGGRRK